MVKTSMTSAALLNTAVGTVYFLIYRGKQSFWKKNFGISSLTCKILQLKPPGATYSGCLRSY